MILADLAEIEPLLEEAARMSWMPADRSMKSSAI